MLNLIFAFIVVISSVFQSGKPREYKAPCTISKYDSRTRIIECTDTNFYVPYSDQQKADSRLQKGVRISITYVRVLNRSEKFYNGYAIMVDIVPKKKP